MHNKNTLPYYNFDKLFDKRNTVAQKLLNCSCPETASLFWEYLKLDSRLNTYICEKKYREGYDAGFING